MSIFCSNHLPITCVKSVRGDFVTLAFSSTEWRNCCRRRRKESDVGFISCMQSEADFNYISKTVAILMGKCSCDENISIINVRKIWCVCVHLNAQSKLPFSHHTHCMWFKAIANHVKMVNTSKNCSFFNWVELWAQHGEISSDIDSFDWNRIENVWMWWTELYFVNASLSTCTKSQTSLSLSNDTS